MSEDIRNSAQPALAAKAMAARESGAGEPHHPAAADHPRHGLQPNARPDHPPSGAFDAEGHRPVLERSRKVR